MYYVYYGNYKVSKGAKIRNRYNQVPQSLLYVNLVYIITYISDKPSLMGGYAFSLMEFVG